MMEKETSIMIKQGFTFAVARSHVRLIFSRSTNFSESVADSRLTFRLILKKYPVLNYFRKKNRSTFGKTSNFARAFGARIVNYKLNWWDDPSVFDLVYDNIITNVLPSVESTGVCMYSSLNVVLKRQMHHVVFIDLNDFIV